MNAPVFTYSVPNRKPKRSSYLARVRLIGPAKTDEGEAAPAGTQGIVVGV